MPRRLRRDFEGAWWHIANRGVAQRAIFTARAEFRRFLALLAGAVRRGEIEVHAYCLMGNHFHLLVRSRRGDVSSVMQRIEDAYARWFNLRHGRDGPLFRGRFMGRIVIGLAYRRTVLAYIHQNPVAARLVDRATDYPFSSAADYARGTGRPWLSRKFGGRLPPGLLCGRVPPVQLVEGWLSAPATAVSDLDGLLRARPHRVSRWLSANALRADGPLAPRLIVSSATMEEVVSRSYALSPDWTLRDGRRAASGWDIVRAGLLRQACALPFEVISRLTQVSPSTAQGRARRHARLLRENPEYSRRAGSLLHAALRIEYGECWTGHGDPAEHDVRLRFA